MTSSSTPNNVVVLVADALRADRVGAYGCDKNLTPILDSLADEGVVFQNAFSCINTTDPSVTSIHTGKYPRSTILHHADLVTDTEKSRFEGVEYVPEELSNAGIRTVATGRPMGRWHRRGFSQYSQSAVEAKEATLSRWLKRIHPSVHSIAASVYNSVTGAFHKGEAKHRNAVEELLASIDTGPFYGFVHLMDTHAWYGAEPELIDHLLAENEYPDGDLREFFDEYSSSPVISNVLEPNAEQADYEAGLARLFARYDAAVRRTDRKVGELIRGLKDQGLWDETALFVLSDHGESLNEHGIYFEHHGLYDQTIEVPLIGHVPGLENRTVTDLVQIHELAPTILDLLDIDPIEDIHGRSLIGYLDDARDTPQSRDSVFIEEAHTQRRHAIRTERFKYIEHIPDDVVADAWNSDSFSCGYCHVSHGETVELYDLTEDPQETTNIAEERPDIVDDMGDKAEDYSENYEAATGRQERVHYEDEEEVLERLEDLGYR